jgi:hypothetical protein
MAGKRVVRLKGGDPYVFGRGGEEAEALRDAGIPFEVVPGATSGIAAPAYAGIPVTHRREAVRVTLLTAHESAKDGGPQVRWDLLAADPHATLVRYMGVTSLPRRVATAPAGMDPATPAAVVGGTTSARRSCGFARRFARPSGRVGIQAPALFVIGPTAHHADRLDWLGDLPLAGTRLVVAPGAASFAPGLEQAGAELVMVPVPLTPAARIVMAALPLSGCVMHGAAEVDALDAERGDPGWPHDVTAWCVGQRAATRPRELGWEPPTKSLPAPTRRSSSGPSSPRGLVRLRASCLGAVAAVLIAGAALAGSPVEEPLRLGVVSFYNPRLMYLKYQPLVDYLTQRTGRRWELTISGSYDATVADLCSGRLAVAYLGPFTYLRAQRACGASPVVQLQTHGQPTYRAHIMVRVDSPISSVGELRGGPSLGAPMSTSHRRSEGMLEAAGCERHGRRAAGTTVHERRREPALGRDACGCATSSVKVRRPGLHSGGVGSILNFPWWWPTASVGLRQDLAGARRARRNGGERTVAGWDESWLRVCAPTDNVFERNRALRSASQPRALSARRPSSGGRGPLKMFRLGLRTKFFLYWAP